VIELLYSYVHIKTVQPCNNREPVEGLSEAFSNPANLKSFYDLWAQEPQPGYEAFIFIQNDPARFIHQQGNRFIIDFDSFYDSTIKIRVEDTANLSFALTSLRAANFFSEDGIVMVFTPELGTMSIFKPKTINPDFVGTSSTGMRVIEKYGGLLSPTLTGKFLFDSVMQTPLLQPIVKPMMKVLEGVTPLGDSPKIDRMMSLLSQKFGENGEKFDELLKNPVKTF
jgi:hypothetical protein